MLIVMLIVVQTGRNDLVVFLFLNMSSLLLIDKYICICI